MKVSAKTITFSWRNDIDDDFEITEEQKKDDYADFVHFGLATSYENHYRHIIIVVMIVSMIGESPGQ